MSIDVILPCYNTNEEIHLLTQNAIESLRTAGDINLIIVDNGSTYAPGYLQDQADIYIRNEQNRGYPAAVNQGLVRTTHDLICVSNNDVRVPPHIFEVAIKDMKPREIGSLHFKMIAYDHPFNHGNVTWITGKERWCTSSFFVIKKAAIPPGGYDEAFGMGSYDDYDFWWRVRHLNGWSTAYTNKAEYQHWGSWTLSQITESEKRVKNNEYFVSKWGKEADELFREQFPKQWEVPYREGFL